MLVSMLGQVPWRWPIVKVLVDCDQVMGMSFRLLALRGILVNGEGPWGRAFAG
jgi:hypothetical protein